jgi:hypothetical protein
MPAALTEFLRLAEAGDPLVRGLIDEMYRDGQARLRIDVCLVMLNSPEFS